MSVVEQFGAPPIPVSATTWRMYSQGVPGAAQNADAAQSPAYPLLKFMSLTGDQMGQVEDLLDRLTYIPPSQGGPPAGSGQLYSSSDLVDPWAADATWLPWLAMVTGRNISGLSQMQSRLGIALNITGDPTVGPTKLPGSKAAIISAVRTLFAYQVDNAQAVPGTMNLSLPTPASVSLPIVQDNLLNAGESSYITGDTSWMEWQTNPALWPGDAAAASPSGIAYQGDYSLGVFNPSGVSTFGVSLSRQIPVLANQTYDLTWYTADAPTNAVNVTAGASVLFYDINNDFLGSAAVSIGEVTSGSWTEGALTFVTPTNTATVFLAMFWAPLEGSTPEMSAVPGYARPGFAIPGTAFTVDSTFSGTALTTYLDVISLSGPDPYGSLRGADLYGIGVPQGASITAIGTVPFVTMSQATIPGIDGTVVVVPNLPIAVVDHWQGNPWSIAVLVPNGIPLSAAYNAALAQKPVGYSLTVAYSFADWATLYQAFGNGANVSWSEIAGLSWAIWEATTS